MTQDEAIAAADRSKRLKAELKAQAAADAALKVAEIVGQGGPWARLSLPAKIKRATAILEAAVSGQVIVPKEMLDAVDRLLALYQWQHETKHGRPRQKLDVTATQSPVIVRDNVQAQLPTTTGSAFAPAVVDACEIAKQSDE